MYISSNTKVIIAIVSTIIFCTISFFLYKKYHIATYTKGVVSNTSWSCLSYQEDSNVICTPTTINGITTTHCVTNYYQYNKRITNGNGFNYFCHVTGASNERFKPSYLITFDVFDSKKISYEADSLQEAMRIENQKTCILGLNENFEIVEVK